MNWNNIELPDNPYFVDEDVVIYCADCRDILPLIPDKSIDLVLTDPPYGIGYDPRIKYARTNKWEEMYKNDDAFDPSPLLLLGNLILWGANCYASRLPDSKTWLAWIKTYTDGKKGQGGDVDFAWANCVGRSRSFYYLWAGYYRDGEIGRYLHPTQKPEALIEWCLSLVPDADLILDPFLGSGTTAYCAKKLGRKCIGIEINSNYCRIAVDRLRQAVLPFEVEQVQQGQSTSESLMLNGMASPTKGNKIRGKMSIGEITEESDR